MVEIELIEEFKNKILQEDMPPTRQSGLKMQIKVSLMAFAYQVQQVILHTTTNKRSIQNKR